MYKNVIKTNIKRYFYISTFEFMKLFLEKNIFKK
jgi:hypothetical protein